MVAEQIIFAIITIITLASALIVVTDRNLFHAALAMMLSFFGAAGYYAMLQSGFMAAAQLLVYIGAISILLIFAIMMTRRLMSATEKPFNSQWIGAIIGSVLLFGLLVFAIANMAELPSDVFGTTTNVFESAPDVSNETLETQVVELGHLMTSSDGYVLPFELISVLLLAALVGSIFIARSEWEREE